MDSKTHNLALLVRDDVTTVSVTFDHSLLTADRERARQLFDGLGPDSDRHLREYTFVCLRTLAATLAPGALVVVVCEYRGQGTVAYKLARVVTVHETPQIDVDAGFPYRWAFQAVDESTLWVREREQARMARRIAEKRRDVARQQTLQALGLSQEDVAGVLGHDGGGRE